MSPQYGELQPTSGWDRSGSFGHPCKFQRVSRLGSVTAWHCSSGCQPNFAVLNIGRHLYSAGWPSHWAFAHISSFYLLYLMMTTFNCFKATLYHIIFNYLLIICNTKQSSLAFNSKCVQYNSVLLILTMIPRHTQNIVVSMFLHGVCHSTADHPCCRSRWGQQAVPDKHGRWSMRDARLCPVRHAMHTPLGHQHVSHHHTVGKTHHATSFNM